MKRRDVMKAALGASAILAAPGLAGAQGTRTLKFVPQANLSSMDAVAGTQYVVRNAALLVWDTLYGVNAKLEPQPQMCAGHEVTADFMTWTFKLRPGLKFHDGAPVTSKDVVASLQRWMARDPMGQLIRTRLTKAEGDITNDLLTKLGMSVDYQALDWGTVGARRAKKDPPGQGGWNIFHTWHAGADCVNPAPYTALDAGGDKAWFGWPNSPEIEARIADWYDAPDLGMERRTIAAINRASFDYVTYAPTGFFLQYQAWRKSLSGVVKAPFPVFWGVRKT